MKTFLKTIALMFVLSGFAACSSEDESALQSLEVTPNNISGVWALAEVDGKSLPETLCCYIKFERRDRKFIMYQKFDSMYPRRLTGTYSITKDEYKGYILDGKYDNGTGEWNNAYIVTALFEDVMLLAADAENGDLCKYVRCNDVPADILGWFEEENAE